MNGITFNAQAPIPELNSLRAQPELDALRNQQPAELAQEFESIFISMMLKEMRQSSGGEGLFPGDASDTYGGIFDMYLGRHLAQQGGFGMAESIRSAIDKQTGIPQ